MKILFISSWYPSESNLNKGVFVKKHAASIKLTGADIVILALTINPSSKVYEKRIFNFVDENNIPTHIIEINSRFNKFLHINIFFQYFLFLKYYRQIIKPVFSPNIIHSNVIYPAGIIGFWISKKEKAKSVITEHWTRLDKFFGKSAYAYFGKRAFKGSLVTVVSTFLKETLVNHNIPKENIHLIPNVIEPYFFSLTKQEKDELVFICCANWTSHKRPDLIFESLEKLSSGINKKIILNVIGTGALLDNYKMKNWNYSVNYLGFMDSATIAKVMSEGKYFLHASNDETFSVVIAEALSIGLPVLASNVGAVPELVNSTNGVLCNNTVDEWVAGILKLINTPEFKSEEIKKGMERFRAENIGVKFNDAYRLILSQ
ncbi:MAG: glycosyltransferase family 4 protein [Bacteroidia bacterium]|nr:glycosyltransferase family 4 protein [Bacteroidia bacterium]